MENLILAVGFRHLDAERSAMLRQTAMRRNQVMIASGLLLAPFLFLIANNVVAQQGPVNIEPRVPVAENRPSAQVRVDSDLVLVPVLVTDKLDRLVPGLDKQSFRVFDNNVEQQISHFAQEDGPISVVLVFDTSGSMQHKLATSRAAVAEFLNESNPEDEFALIQFADHARLVTGFTQDSGEIQNRLAFLAAQGRTALVDAIFLALDQMKHARHARKAILVLSDGGDNRSRHSKNELKRRVRESDVQIYAIGILDAASMWDGSPEEINGPYLLSEIANQTGGRMFPAESLGGLVDIAKRIGAALRNQYVLGYSPSAMKRDGRYHSIVVKLPPTSHQVKWRASFRRSYLAPPN